MPLASVGLTCETSVPDKPFLLWRLCVTNTLRLLAVHAHPDDESSKGAATMARYVREGVEVLVVSCTGGERGDVLNPALAADPVVLADLAAVRQREMHAARDILGVQHAWLGFHDSGLPEGDPLPPLPAPTTLRSTATRVIGSGRSGGPRTPTPWCAAHPS